MALDTFVVKITAQESDRGERIDRVVAARVPDSSRSFVQKLISAGEITVNDAEVLPSYRLRPSDDIVIRIPPGEADGDEIAADPLDLSIAYEDANVIVFDKPAGLVVHPSPGHKRNTLVNAFKWMRPDAVAAGTDRPGVVQRLDKDTTGLIVLAKNERSRLDLLEQWRSRSVLKEYVALVIGHLPKAEAIVDAPIGRDPHHRKRMAVVPGGREAISHLRTIQRFQGYSLLEVRIETGRTHQIRVHCAFTGHPVAGDILYGGTVDELPLGRQFLHASRLRFKSPTGDVVDLSSPLPADLTNVLEVLKNRS